MCLWICVLPDWDEGQVALLDVAVFAASRTERDCCHYYDDYLFHICMPLIAMPNKSPEPKPGRMSICYSDIVRPAWLSFCR
jgi:hypothetical protein